MFIGEYQHAIDPKKRLALPSKFRKDLGTTVVVTRGLDHCLFVYPHRTWQELAEKLGKMPVGEATTRSFVRLMLAGATDVVLDQQGRVLLPEYLKVYAGLRREVTIAGLYNRLEVWDKSSWEEYRKNSEDSSNDLAEKLGELGI